MRLVGWILAALAAGLCLASTALGAITVKPGDTLSGLAARHGTSVAALARANGIFDPDAIVAGQRLRLPGAAAPAVASGPATAGVVTVAPGDTLSGIAARHGTTVSALAAANGIRNPHAIVAGQRLSLPGSASGGGSAPASSSGGGSYVVRAGETLGQIALRHGTSVGALAALNGISNPNLLVAGSAIWLPAGGAAPLGAGARPASGAPGGGSVTAMIEAAAARHGVDPRLARAVAWQESGFSQAARSSVGAIGVMQLMPVTATWLGSDVLGRAIDPGRVEDNVDAGVAYLAWLQARAASTEDVVAGYYQGLSSVRRIGYYDDTKQYVAAVLAQVGRV
jgi:LysM repeat protein